MEIRDYFGEVKFTRRQRADNLCGQQWRHLTGDLADGQGN